jgi:hypothetical protein
MAAQIGLSRRELVGSCERAMELISRVVPAVEVEEGSYSAVTMLPEEFKTQLGAFFHESEACFRNWVQSHLIEEELAEVEVRALGGQ